jgi:selenocysteine lyase/cysteine desulfurase
MTLLNLKPFYQYFLQHHADVLHFAAHSHHFWPDVTRQAHLEYWEDSARYSDDKWDKIFQEVLPKAKSHIGKILHLKDHEQIVFAPNTHELSSRILSLFLGKSHLKILTTSSEFTSWNRQLLRLMELPQIEVEMIKTESLLHDRKIFVDEFLKALQNKPDLVFLSQVFFDSGLALHDLEIENICEHISPSTIIVVDGYHGFSALPTQLTKLEGKIFYLAGGYKYAQAGEGVGFCVVPHGDYRPSYTGWFAQFGELAKSSDQLVGYPKNAMAFGGATTDSSGLYRLNATWDLFEREGINVQMIHEHIRQLQLCFIQSISPNFLKKFELIPLFNQLNWHGHFLTYKLPDENSAQIFVQKLKQARIKIDSRGDRVRFGFGAYHDKEDVLRLCQQLKEL